MRLLCVCSISCWMGMCILPAQVSNAELYESLWEKELASMTQTLVKIKGSPLPEVLEAYVLDSSASWSMQLFPPLISYRKLDGSTIERSFRQSYQLEGQGLQAGSIIWKDTLSRRAMRRLIRKSPEGLKGENPSLWVKWVRPAIWITGSTAAIISLFYLRSREQ